MFKNIVIAIVLILFSLNSFSYERHIFHDSDRSHIIASYKEGSLWFLKKFEIKKNQLQELTLSQTFTNPKQLQTFKTKLLKKYSHLKYRKSAPQKFSNTEVPNKSLWPVTKSWTLAEEEKFIEWLEKNFDKKFFIKYNIKTDCADVAFSLRWIFARMNGLPAANTMAGSHILFTHESMKKEWESLPTHTEWHQDKRFLAALDYINLHAFTGTLGIDAYPIEITKETFRVGTIHLTGGHTMIISKIDYSGKDAPIKKLSSTVPAAIRELHEEIMLDTDLPENPIGYLRMRWPIFVNGHWVLKEKEKMPFYSDEQYSENFLNGEKSITLAIIKRLNIPFNPKKLIKNATQDLYTQLTSRVSIVEEGFRFCSQNDCKEGSMNYEDHSTPSRDGKISKKFKQIDGLVNQFSIYDQTIPSVWEDFQSKTHFTVLEKKRTIAEMRKLFSYSIPSYHPEDSIEERWAIDEASSMSSLEKKALRLKDKRIKLLNASSFCVNTNECLPKSTKWFENNTYVFDQKITKEIYAAAKYLEQKYTSQSLISSLSKKVQDFIDEIPFFVSEPRFDTQTRFGDHRFSLNYFDIGLAKRILEITKNIFVIDDKLIDISKNKVLLDNIKKHIALYDYEHKLIMAQNNQISLLDINSRTITDSVIAPFEIQGIQFLGGSYFYVVHCKGEGETCQASIYNIVKDKIDLVVQTSVDSWRLNLYKSPISSQVKNSFLKKDSHLVYYVRDNKLLTIKAGANRYFTSVDTSDDWFLVVESDYDSNLDIKAFSRTDSFQCSFHAKGDFWIGGFKKNLIMMNINGKDSLYLIDRNTCINELNNLPDGYPSIESKGDFVYVNVYPEEAGATKHYVLINNGLKDLNFPKNVSTVSFEKNSLVNIEYDPDSREFISAFRFNVLDESLTSLELNSIDFNCSGIEDFFNTNFKCAKNSNGTKAYSFFQTVGQGFEMYALNTIKDGKPISSFKFEWGGGSVTSEVSGWKIEEPKIIYAPSFNILNPTEDTYILIK